MEVHRWECSTFGCLFMGPDSMAREHEERHGGTCRDRDAVTRWEAEGGAVDVDMVTLEHDKGRALVAFGMAQIAGGEQT